MRTTTSVKASAAFLAGIVVALGGALVYFRATDSHLKPAIQVASLDEQTPSVPNISVPPPKTPAGTVTEQPAVPSAQTKYEAHSKAAKPKSIPENPRITSRPVSLAVWHPKKQAVQEPAVQDLPAPSAPLTEPTREPHVSPPSPAQQIPAPPPQPHTVTIPAGTSVAVRLNEKLSTEHNFSGDTFRATLDTPIVMDGFIIADKGAKVLGRIVKAEKPGKFEGMAELSLTLTEVATTDGQRLRMQTNESLRKGPSNTNEEVIKMGGGAALGAIIGALSGGGKGAAIGAGAGGAAGTGAVLLGHGRPAVIDSETRLTFALASPTTITEQLN